MDIDKVRTLSDAELDDGPARGQAGPVGSALRAVHAPTEGLQHDPADAANDRADPDRPARAQARQDGLTGHHAMTGANTKVQGKRKTKVGRVVSDKMDKTIVVSVERLARHRLYKRVIRLTTKFKAHDETNDAHIGDTVLIEESRPLSATKRWRLVSVIARAGEHGLPGETVVVRGGRDERGHPRRRPPGSDPCRRGRGRHGEPDADRGCRRRRCWYRG